MKVAITFRPLENDDGPLTSVVALQRLRHRFRLEEEIRRRRGDREGFAMSSPMAHSVDVHSRGVGDALERSQRHLGIVQQRCDLGRQI